MPKYMVLDKALCFGCNACVVACQQEYGLPATIKFNRVDVTVSGSYPNPKIDMQPMVCAQCGGTSPGFKSPCMTICPVGAITRDSATGVVVTDRNKCAGCRLCTTQTGCPYKMRSIDGSGKSVKCNFCLDRITGTPAEAAPYCVKTCPAQARRLVDDVPVAGSGEVVTQLDGPAGVNPRVYFIKKA